jgi:DNA repair protein RecO (recombination protein O)
MANFHLIFDAETTKYLGFYPDTSDVDMPPFLK